MNNSLFGIWTIATLSRREAVRNALPERIYDAVVEDPSLLTKDFIEYLKRLVTSDSVPYWETQNAIRLIGILVEDDYLDKADITSFFSKVLIDQKDLRIIYWICEAAHQGYLFDLTPELQVKWDNTSDKESLIARSLKERISRLKALQERKDDKI